MSGFGTALKLDGQNGVTAGTAVPLDLMKAMKLNAALPITVSGSSNVTFTLNASVTNPVVLWNGTDYIYLRTTLAYTFAAGATNTILNSSGAVVTLQSPVTDIWYYYVGITADNVIDIYPSQSAPSFAEGPNENGNLSHPGTARTSFWNYIGFSLCTATTPAFVTMTLSAVIPT